jgi:NAD(P)H-dependent flavin oxidoreductase YrpB (nitropropane dioxygenase family)
MQMSAENLTEQVRAYPDIFQGGMGIAISNWRLAGEVAARGAAGIVSGVAIGEVLVRRLQNDDVDPLMQQALKQFPDKKLVEDIQEQYHLPGGKDENEPYANTPSFTGDNRKLAVELNMLGAFTEVRRAQLRAHLLKGQYAPRGPIGINLLTKVEQTTPSALYGAMLAGVDFVVMGAGIPADIPQALDNLAKRQPAATQFNVAGSGKQHYEVSIDPSEYPELSETEIERPPFFAIVSSKTLAAYLARNPQTRPDGLVVEGPVAGGHNAPPRGELTVDELGQPIYGPRDEMDLKELAKLGIPYWVAGGYGNPAGLARAKEQGANGIQVGGVFAVCEDSGMAPWGRKKLIQQALGGGIKVLSSSRASSTGYPFKVDELAGTLSDEEVYNLRRRVCDQKFLSETSVDKDGSLSYRCPSEPIESYVRNGGDRAATIGRICLCNGLLAAAGLGQVRNKPGGLTYEEPAIFTLGDQASEAIQDIVDKLGRQQFSANDVLKWLRSEVQTKKRRTPTGRSS